MRDSVTALTRIGAALFLCVALVVSLSFADDAAPATPAEPAPAAPPVSYHKDILPIFRQACFGCHQGAKQLGDYRMTDFESLVRGGESGEVAIVPGKPDDSYLIAQITPMPVDPPAESTPSDQTPEQAPPPATEHVAMRAEMPKAPAKSLSQVEVELIRRWVSEGAINDSPTDSRPRFDSEHPPIYNANPALPSVAVSTDGKTIAIAGYYEVLLIDRESGQTKAHLVGESPRINSVRFSPDGTRLAVAGGRTGEMGEIQVWNVATATLELSKQITYDTLNGVSWSPDGSMIAFGANDKVVRAIQSTTGEQVLFQGAHEDWVLDTVFTADGSHLVTVARDMSCKLTEVATERFIDNVTSITPGALSGGLSSVARHPQRNEIVVGGADGVAKVYRVFRETARKIGDDANLIRRLPALQGRIFSVAVSPDGSRIAAAATLDGKSEVRVWQYDFSGELDNQIKAIQAKREQDRTEEEKAKLQAYNNGETKQLAQWTTDKAAVYAIAFGPNNELAIAATDGHVRMLAADGALASEIAAITVTPTTDLAFAIDARAWTELQTRAIEAGAQPTAAPKLAPERIKSLSVSPESIQLDSAYAYAQLVITATMDDGATIDVTRDCSLTTPAWATASSSGMIRAVSDGDDKLVVRLGSQEVVVPISAKNTNDLTVDFVRDVNPVLSRLGCNQGTCHGAQAGKNGFKLSLRGYDPIFDLRSLTDELAGRRINPANPQESVMIRKPLGLTPHQGGTLMSEGDSNHAILRRWIADGAKLDLGTPRVTSIEVFPTNPVAQTPGDLQQVRVVAHFADGLVRDVTREAFVESGNTEVATATQGGMLTAVRRGEAPILARYEGAYAATTLTVMGDRTGYETVAVEPFNEIDKFVADKWQRMKIVPSDVCDDNTFLRRVYLDLTGLPPTSDEVRAFIADESPMREKRAAVIDRLIASDAFIEHWANKWADLLQVNRKFLGVEGSKAFREWIRTAIAENRPYDQFAREVLTATGSNKDNPPASYYKILRDADLTMENTTHLFLGIRFNCNKCHDHPFERWTQDQYFQMAAYFARVGLQNDPASGDQKIGGTAVEGAKPLYEKVVDKGDGEIKHGRTNEVVAPAFPFDVPHESPENATRREQLAAWMTDADNPYFARSYVNRLWGYMLGVGLIEPIDDIRAGNPPTNPELLDHLTTSFVESGFNTREILRKICNSRTYQLSVATNPLNEDDKSNYSHATPRRLPAEVLYDTVHALTGSVSSVPGVAKGTRAAALDDAGVNLPDGFLTNLGRPVRESACECERSSELQLGPVMALISGPTIGTAISDANNELAKIVGASPTDDLLAEELFLRALARKPTEAEMEAFESITKQIHADHQTISDQLATAEQEWIARREALEKQRLEAIEATKQEIAKRTTDIQPERDRLAKEREEKIAAAQAVVDGELAKLAEKGDAYLSGNSHPIEWFPLTPHSAKSDTGVTLTPLADRSIIARGDKREKGIHTLEFKTTLPKITGIRLETLADPELPAGGPGLGDNGNFVITELVVKATAHPKADAPANQEASKPMAIKIASGKANFSQDSFAIEQTFDGQLNNQGGWAAAPVLGVSHWATFKFAEPIANPDGIALTIELHQFHNAPKHLLGRFRISVTTDQGDIPLSLPEPLDAIARTAKELRSEADSKLVERYVSALDPGIKAANDALAVARTAVPPDDMLVQLESRLKQLQTPTTDDPALVQLREDVKQSAAQLQNIRLTAAEDLTWALVNSPAFLFNH